MLWFLGLTLFGERLGLVPKPKPRPVAPPVAEADVEPANVAKDAAAADAVKDNPAAVAPVGPKVEKARPEELVLGSLDDQTGYLLCARFAQEGAGVDVLELARHMAERQDRTKKRLPLKLIPHDPDNVPSFGLNLLDLGDSKEKDGEEPPVIRLDNALWEAVRDDQEPRPQPVINPKNPGVETGQEIAFRVSTGSPAVTITKTFRLSKGHNGLDLILGFASPSGERKVAYQLSGPHGIPIEGDWYTSVFREVFFGLAKADGTTQVETRLASDIVKKVENPEVFQTLPIRYVGVENQYFTVFLEPDPATVNDKGRIDEATHATVVEVNDKDKQRSDVSVSIASKPIEVGPNRTVHQDFKIYAGPKTTETLKPFGAEDLAAYRKSWVTIPYASWLAQNAIAPGLDKIYGFTTTVAKAFGGKHGNYGIAIILLTFTVRMILFPLSRKQAIAAKRMSDLAPKMAELKEKYKDDKEAQTRETFALYKTHKVNPMGGCLLGLIQLPIFVGLWQALNNSVRLRHASFLWIDNLAAPDMLFKFPFDVPYLGRYFNLLPFAVVGLMLIQMKLFTPPATTPDQEMSQKMMKYMMVFMSFMFYKVPSGLGLYFITSSSWAICERLLLPKMIKSKPIEPEVDPGDGRLAARPRPGGNGNGNGNGPAPPKPGGFRDRLRQIVEEASKDRTVRNDDKDRDRDWGKGGNRPRPKPGKRK